MSFGAGKKIIQKTSAGLAIHNDFVHFVELDENGEITRKASAALPEGCVVHGQIKDFDGLGETFKALVKKTGKIRQPVTIGLPSGDTVIRRPLSFPRMSIEDIRSTIDLNFEEYFTTRADTIFDAVIIRTPSDTGDKDTISVLAATTKKSLVDKILDLLKKADIPAGAVEPLNFAMLRYFPEIKEGLSIIASPHNIIATWDGCGIFFRVVNNLNNFQDVLNTMQFLSTQYRQAQVSKIILAHVNFQLSTDSRMEIINNNDPFFSAIGLAMREDSESGLDLRPAEYVELERRRYSFNPNRLALWGLLAGFLMMSLGTISYAFMTMNSLTEKIDSLRGNLGSLTAQRQRLERENSQLEAQRKQTEKILDFLKGDIPVLEILNALEVNIPDGVKYDNADFVLGPLGGVNVVVDGKARSDKEIIAMTEGLKESGLFDSVMLPVSQKDQLQRKVFKVVLRVKDILVMKTEETSHGK
ncbi:MAG: pilus assembly protein PilM [Synergistaceae bacterium]|nr:pilus assembly protein PilM [Synergistaceae bacterium]